MKKSLNLLLALALVFTLLTPAMAFAATSQESAAGAKLQQYGVLSGGTDGDLMLDADLKREDMIVLLSRLLGAEEEAKAHENNHGFTDVDNSFYDSYISWAKAEGLTNGIGNDRFGQNTNLKLKDLLQFQLRVLGYADVAYDDVPAKAEELGLVEAGLDAEAPVTRGQMSLVTLNALNTEVNGEGIQLGAKLEIDEFIPDVGILAFAATGAKKLEVKFASAVDTDEAEVTVKRGTVTVNTSDIKWSSDKKTATIETASRLVEGTYTVSVEGVVEDEALTASVDVENEKVESIEILNDTAPMGRKSNGEDNAKQVIVNYVVKNQYGENVSNVYVPNATASGVVDENANGSLKVSKTSGDDYVIRESVFVSLVYIGTNYTVTAQKTMEVGLSAKADAVEITELYNDNADAVLDTDVSDSEASAFKLLLDVKDQYGNTVKDLSILKKDLIVNVVGTHIFDVQFEDTQRNVPSFEIVDIDGESFVALPLKEVKSKGSAVVNVIPRYSGKSGNFTVVVEEGLIYDQVILSPVSGIVAANEDVFVPVTVLDTKGNTVTDTKKLNDALGKQVASGAIKLNISASNNAALEFVTKDGSLYLKFKVTQAGPVTINATTENFKHHFVTIDVKEEAKPRTVIGLKSDTNRLIFKNDTLELTHKNILVEDNYGRVMSEGALETALKGDFKISINEIDPASKVTVVGTVYEVDKDQVTGDLTKIVLTGNAKGTTAVTLQLHDDNITSTTNTDKVVGGSQWESTLRAVEMDEISSIEIENIGALYAGKHDWTTAPNMEKYQKEVKVVGLTKDGKKVSISANNNNFQIISFNGDVTLATINKLTAAHTIFSDANKETTANIRVVLANGLSAEQEVKVTNEAPKVDSLKIKDLTDGVLVVNAGTLSLTNGLNVEIKDQYGAEAGTAFADGTALPTASVTFSDLPEGRTVNNNGQSGANVVAQSGDEFTVTVKYGSVSATTKVRVR